MRGNNPKSFYNLYFFIFHMKKTEDDIFWDNVMLLNGPHFFIIIGSISAFFLAVPKILQALPLPEYPFIDSDTDHLYTSSTNECTVTGKPAQALIDPDYITIMCADPTARQYLHIKSGKANRQFLSNIRQGSTITYQPQDTVNPAYEQRIELSNIVTINGKRLPR